MIRFFVFILLLFPFQIHTSPGSKADKSKSVRRRLYDLITFRKYIQIYPDDAENLSDEDKTIERSVTVHKDSNRNIKRNTNQTIQLDILSSLCDEMLSNICDYLDRSSILSLRGCNKELLRGYTQVNNIKLMKQLRPRISFETQLLVEKRLASTFFASFSLYLSSLIDKICLEYLIENNIFIITLTNDQKAELDNVLVDLRKPSMNFETFLRTAILFYYYTDPLICWNIIEISIKSDILHLSDLSFLPAINHIIVFESSCEFGLVSLSKELLMFTEDFALDLFDGCVRCINKGEIKIFKNILNSALKLNNYFDVEKLNLLLEISIKSIKIDFVEILFQTFPCLKFTSTDVIFWIIKSKNCPLLEVLLKYRGGIDLELKNMEGLSPFDVCAKNNFWEGIRYMSRFYENPSIRVYSLALRFAISSRNYISVQALISGINRNFGSFANAINKTTIIGFIINAIDSKNLSIIKYILDNSPKNVLSFEGEDMLLFKSEIFENYLSPVFKVIRDDFLEGFMCLLDRFGIELLDKRDHKGLTPLLMAASLGNVRFFRMIHSLRPESIDQVDFEGNNSLHLAFSLTDPMSFINSVLDLNLDWNHFNEEHQSPIDILINHPSIKSEDIILVYNVYTMKFDK